MVYRHWATCSRGTRSLRIRTEVRRALRLPQRSAWGQPPGCRARVRNQQSMAVLQMWGDTVGISYGSRWRGFANSKYKRWWNHRERERWAKGLPKSLSECWPAHIGERIATAGKEKKTRKRADNAILATPTGLARVPAPTNGSERPYRTRDTR